MQNQAKCQNTEYRGTTRNGCCAKGDGGHLYDKGEERNVHVLAKIPEHHVRVNCNCATTLRPARACKRRCIGDAREAGCCVVKIALGFGQGLALLHRLETRQGRFVLGDECRHAQQHLLPCRHARTIIRNRLRYARARESEYELV